MDFNVKPLIIYICAPYTPKIEASNKEIELSGGKIDPKAYQYYRDQNIERANNYGKQVFLIGHIPLIPHNNTAGWEDDPRFKSKTHTDWINMCLILLKGCGAMLMCPGWQEQAGCKKELEYFHQVVKGHVFYSVDDIPSIDQVPV